MTGSPALPRRIVARRARPAVLATAAAAAAVTAALGIWLAGRRTFTEFDLRNGLRIARAFDGHLTAAVRLADLGGPLVVSTATLALAVAMLILRRLRAALFAAVAAPAASMLTEFVLKPLIDRAPFGVYTYPSGHATAAFALATAFALLVLDETAQRPPRVARIALAGAAVLLAGVIAVALVAARYHFVTDVIGGAGVGSAATLLLALIIDAIADARRAPG